VDAVRPAPPVVVTCVGFAPSAAALPLADPVVCGAALALALAATPASMVYVRIAGISKYALA
jgi:hypothetical protein